MSSGAYVYKCRTPFHSTPHRIPHIAALTRPPLPPPPPPQLVAIANDITYNSGAFGPAEDAAFRAATEWALAERLPVVYLAANSGARVGLATEVKQCLRVEWVQPGDPTKGHRYLYLSPEDYRSLEARAAAAGAEGSGAPAVHARRLVTEGGEERYQLTGGPLRNK